MSTFLFGEERIATTSVGRSKYCHTFGGPHDRRGTSRKSCQGIHIHLVYRFDLTDPAIPISIPGIRWLPIYYCFDFRANHLGYRLISDNRLKAYFPTDDPNISKHEEWPADDYPMQFRQHRIKIVAHPYDPTKRDDVLNWIGIFGMSKLARRDKSVLKRRAIEWASVCGTQPPETDEQVEKCLSKPFVQGCPDDPCLNPNCDNYSLMGRMTTIAIVPGEPIKGFHTFGVYGDDVQLIVQLCRECRTVRVSNQCT